MKKMFMIGIAAICILIAAWAAAFHQTGRHEEAAVAGIDVLTMMAGARDLPVEHYDAF